MHRPSWSTQRVFSALAHPPKPLRNLPRTRPEVDAGHSLCSHPTRDSSLTLLGFHTERRESSALGPRSNARFTSVRRRGTSVRWTPLFGVLHVVSHSDDACYPRLRPKTTLILFAHGLSWMSPTTMFWRLAGIFRSRTRLTKLTGHHIRLSTRSLFALFRLPHRTSGLSCK